MFMPTKKTKVVVKRRFWVDWVCSFDDQPTADDLKEKKEKLRKYIFRYLDLLIAGKGPKSLDSAQMNPKQPVKAIAQVLQIWNPNTFEWENWTLKHLEAMTPQEKKEREISPAEYERFIAFYKGTKGPGGHSSEYWKAIFKDELLELSKMPSLFNYRSYFDDDEGHRYTAEGKGSMTPPNPPPPPSGGFS
jgi:hypothetical protein